MFTIDCPSHGSRVLVTSRRIRHLTNTDAGILLDVECWCGTHVAVLTGRHAAPARLAAAATPTLARAA